MELQKSALLNVQRADLFLVHPVVCLFVTMPEVRYNTFLCNIPEKPRVQGHQN